MYSELPPLIWPPLGRTSLSVLITGVKSLTPSPLSLLLFREIIPWESLNLRVSFVERLSFSQMLKRANGLLWSLYALQLLETLVQHKITEVLMQIFCARHKKVRLSYSGTSVIRNAGFVPN